MGLLAGTLLEPPALLHALSLASQVRYAYQQGANAGGEGFRDPGALELEAPLGVPFVPLMLQIETLRLLWVRDMSKVTQRVSGRHRITGQMLLTRRPCGQIGREMPHTRKARQEAEA